MQRLQPRQPQRQKFASRADAAWIGACTGPDSRVPGSIPSGGTAPRAHFRGAELPWRGRWLLVFPHRAVRPGRPALVRGFAAIGFYSAAFFSCGRFPSRTLPIPSVIAPRIHVQIQNSSCSSSSTEAAVREGAVEQEASFKQKKNMAKTNRKIKTKWKISVGFWFEQQTRPIHAAIGQ